MNKTILLTALALALVGAGTASAAGLHVGASIGQAYFTADPANYDEAFDQAKKIDENSTAWKLFAGFSGGSFLGVEGGYRDFGKVDSTLGSEKFESKTKGFDIEAVGRIQIVIVDLFAKAGVMFWSNDGKVSDIEFDDSGTDFLWGLGAGVHLGSIGVRLEWESLEGGKSENLSMVSLGATLGF